MSFREVGTWWVLSFIGPEDAGAEMREVLAPGLDAVVPNALPVRNPPHLWKN